MELLAPIEHWAISIHSLEGRTGAEEGRRLKEQGKSVWVYGDTPMLNTPASAAFRSIYQTWMHGFDGFMFWKSTARKLDDNDGRDFILYAISTAAERGIFPSLRLKLLRRAIDDTRIMELAEAQGLTNRKILEQQVEAFRYGDSSTALNFREQIIEWKQKLMRLSYEK